MFFQSPVSNNNIADHIETIPSYSLHDRDKFGWKAMEKERERAAAPTPNQYSMCIEYRAWREAKILPHSRIHSTFTLCSSYAYEQAYDTCNVTILSGGNQANLMMMIEISFSPHVLNHSLVSLRSTLQGLQVVVHFIIFEKT